MSSIGDLRHDAGIDLQIDANGPRLYNANAFTTGEHIGTPGTNVTAVEHGDGYDHTTILTLTGVAFTADSAADIADGAIIYTFPAARVVIDSAYLTMAFTLSGTPKTDTPDVGLGSVIASGSVAILSGTGTFEDILTGQTWSTGKVDGTVQSAAAGPTAGGPLALAANGKVHLNLADAWATISGSEDITATGTVVVNWHYMGV